MKGSVMAIAAAGASSTARVSHPVQLEIPYPESLSRWKIFLKWLFIIPNSIILAFVLIGVSITTFLAWFAVLFTGHYPRGLFDFAESTMRWSVNVAAYSWLLRDEYPPFSGSPGHYPVEFSVAYPEHLNQIMVFFKGFALIPSVFVFFFVLLAAYVVSFVSFFAILFTGKMPPGMHSFLTGTLRWSARINAYYYLMTDAYPPFHLGA